MPVSFGLDSIMVMGDWSIGPFVVRGNDVYAILGLIAVVALLSLWVVFERLRQAQVRLNQTASSDGNEPDAHLTSRPAQPDMPIMAPVPASTQWLLDDNTLVRTRAVRRGPMRPPSPPQPTVDPAPDFHAGIAWQEPAAARHEDEPATQPDDGAMQYPDLLSRDPTQNP